MRVMGILALAMTLVLGTRFAEAQILKFDWGVRNSQVGGSEVLPVPHQGHDYPANHSFYQNLYNTLDAQGLPIAVMLQNDQGGNGTLNAVLDNVSVGKMDYVMADFESVNRESHVNTMVSQVRNHANANVNDAYIGNYAMYPGAYDASMHFAHIADRTIDYHSDAHNFYLDSGLNIAQPNAYPYEYYEVHTYDAGGIVGWGTFLSPNKRSALFWAPLERVSVARRSLNEEVGHEDDLLIPWLAGAVEWNNYDAPDPTVEDHKALAQHIRLRGADGYYTLVSWIGGDGSTTTPPGYPTHTQYRENVSDAWNELNYLFNFEQAPEILNLDTVKTTGVEWSGMRQQNLATFLVSNLGDSPAQVDFPDLPGVPDLSPVVPVGTHQTFIYQVISPDVLGDYNASGLVEQGDLDLVLLNWGAAWPPTVAGWTNQQPTDDGIINQNDLDGVLLNWGNTAAVASAPVPEPASLALLVFGALGFVFASRRSR